MAYLLFHSLNPASVNPENRRNSPSAWIQWNPMPYPLCTNDQGEAYWKILRRGGNQRLGTKRRGPLQGRSPVPRAVLDGSPDTHDTNGTGITLRIIWISHLLRYPPNSGVHPGILIHGFRKNRNQEESSSFHISTLREDMTGIHEIMAPNNVLIPSHLEMTTPDEREIPSHSLTGTSSAGGKMKGSAWLRDIGMTVLCVSPGKIRKSVFNPFGPNPSRRHPISRT